MMMQLDRNRCSELPELENALLWCMRAWVIGHCNHRKVSDRMASIFAKLGAAGAVSDLDGLMWALSQGARRTIEVNCVCYSEVSADERMLLDAFALEQQEDHEDAYAILIHLMTERAAAIACDHAHRLALSLAAAGRLLSLPQHGCALGMSTCANVARSGYLH